MAWTKAKTAAVAGLAMILCVGTTVPIVVSLHRAASLKQLSTIHIRGQMRTYPADNFGAIATNAGFVTVELWKQLKPDLKWRVEKPGRVAVMDGQSALLYVKPVNTALKAPGATPSAFDTDWIQALATLDAVTNEMKTARAKHWQTDSATVWTNGQRQTVVRIMVESGLPDSSNQKNVFLDTSDRRDVFRYDAKTKRLESVQIYLVSDAGETLVFESEQIDYNQKIDPTRFHYDLPADVAWFQEPQKTTGPDAYSKLTADEAARSFFEACSHQDWNEAGKFWYTSSMDQRTKDYLGGIRIVHLGEAYASAPYPGRFVPYEIELRPQEMNVRVSNTNAAGRYVINGTYDKNLKPLEPLDWTTAPASLPAADADAKLDPAEVVKAYFAAMANQDWDRMGKFAPQSDVTSTRSQMEEAKKLEMPLPHFEVGQAVWSPDDNSYFVKCTMTGTKKFRLAIRNDNPAKHWIVDGGI